jgi:23S rRNA pseudouridine2605 synthase/23S rRNA pseudouridine2604 synthase
MALVRLQKFLSQAGVCSRRKGEVYILDGRVRVNGKPVNTLGTKIDPLTDRVTVDGRPVAVKGEKIYLALNKPKGYVTSCSHPGKPLVIDLVDLPQRIYPIGRLDRDSTGLLLLTNDGGLHHQLSHPSFDHEKEYEVTVERPIGDDVLNQMAAGIRLKGVKTRPARVTRLSGRRFRMVLKEGRNRQIRRMAEQMGHTVIRLKRIRMASIRLGDLPAGAWRFLTPAEKRHLLKGVPRG